MSVFQKIGKSVRATAARGTKVAVTRVGVALNRADELGGEARDLLQGWWGTSPAAARVRTIIGKERSREDQVAAETARREAEIADKTAAAPPPTAAAEAAAEAAKGMGNPELPAQVYGTRSCAWSGRSIRLLEDRKIDYDFIDLDEPENGDLLSRRLIPETKQNTVPFIYVRGEFVGGYNALSELDRLGQLQLRVLSTAERAKRENGRTAVEVARRVNTDEVAPGERRHPADAAPADRDDGEQREA